MNNEQHIDEQLWKYIDGFAAAEERTAIEELIRHNLDWKQRYDELLNLQQMLQQYTETEEPSMRFTQNVMDQVAMIKVAKATGAYINKKIIRGLALFFIITIASVMIFNLGHINWSSTGTATGSLDTGLDKVEPGKYLNSTVINIVIMLNVILGLALFDRYLTNKKKKATEL